MVRQSALVVLACSFVLVPAVASARQSGGGATETVATIRDRDLNGAERIVEMVVTRRAASNGGEEVVIETYRPLIYQDRLMLARRVRRVTTPTPDGSRTVEDVEEAPLGSPHDPVRVVQRSVTTTRRSAADAEVTERRIFERDGNGRFVPARTETERVLRR